MWKPTPWGATVKWTFYLARYDVLGSIAHITMLQTINLLTTDELSQLTAALREIYAEIEAGKFVIEDGIEDVHSQVELMLTRRLGDVGKKIHSGRSRNDQVLVDLRLFIRSEIEDVVHHITTLFHTLQAQSERYKDVLMPGYTHLQVAMPSSFGLWFGAYAESLADDLVVLRAAYDVNNRNPLGSAAGYGSSSPPQPRTHHAVARICVGRLQCGVCPDGAWQDRANRGSRHRQHCRHHFKTGVRRMYV